MSAESSRLDRQGAHTLVATALSVALGLLLSIIAARTLGPAGKGVLDLTSATAGLFTLVLGLSLNASITHRVARDNRTPAGLTGQLALWGTGAGAITIALLCARPDIAGQLGLLPGHDPLFWAMFVGTTVAFGVWATGLRGIIIGQHALITSNRIDVAVKAALLAGYGLLMFTGPAEPKWYALVGLGGAALLPFAFLFALRGPVGPAGGTWPALFAAALPVHGTNILHFINQRADVFFVQAFHGPVEVALYALAVSLAQFVLLLSSALAQPLLPQVSAAKDAVEAAAVTARACRLFVVLGLVAGVALALVAPGLVPLVFGRSFSGSLPALLVLLPGMITFGVTNIIISYFVGIGRGQVNLWISLFALVLTIGGNLWLTRSSGAIGAAVTSLAAYALAGGLSVILLARHARLPLRHIILPVPADWRAAFALVARFRP